MSWLGPREFPSAYLFLGETLIGGWAGFAGDPHSAEALAELSTYLQTAYALGGMENPEQAL
ncbi:MAG TPA: hypothetical protein VGC56_12015 [Allosphingosinicella sp.]|jgi:hypothetical protein